MTPVRPATSRERTRAAVNWLNLSTPLGLLVARVGGATRPAPGPGGLRIATGYRLRVPVAGAFTVGNVVTTKHGPAYLLGPGREHLLAHEARHASQYALLGPFFLPAYGTSAVWSWLVSGEPGGRNVFERWAGLGAGGYTRHPLRPGLVRLLGAGPPARRPAARRPAAAGQLRWARSRKAAES